MSNSEEAFGPELVIQHTGQIFSLTQESITIGGEEDNSIVFDDPQVAGHHASISWQAEAEVYMIEDLDSPEGTYVNEVRIEEPQILRQGDVIRVGATVVDVRLEVADETVAEPVPVVMPPPDAEEPEAKQGLSPVLIGVLVGLAAIVTLACVAVFLSLLLGGSDAPDVVIQSPADGSQVVVGSEIILQATATGVDDITLLELTVDDALVATSTSPDPKGAASLTVSKAWRFDAIGEHKVSAVAYTASGKTSKPVSVDVIVVSSSAEVTPATATSQPTATTKPDQPTNTPKPGETVPPPPQIEYFRASPDTITAGGCTTLQWGKVSDATEAKVEPEVGGVGTPDSAQVCPTETTTYVLTAAGPGGTTQASTVVTVMGGLPDLTVESISYDPPTPIVGENTDVRITIRNLGVGAAGAFNWEWDAGPAEGIQRERVRGLNGGESIVVSFTWNPGQPYPDLRTEARVDVDNEVDESDKNNNSLTVNIQVVEAPSEPETATIRSDGALDGYVVNDGTSDASKNIVVGNGSVITPTGELVARGFLSFDLSGIPQGATIQSIGLRFFQKTVEGNPYGKLGSLTLEHVVYGGSLAADAFNTPALGSLIPAQQPTAGSLYAITDDTVAGWIQADLAAGRTRCQIRLRFSGEADGDGQEDWITIEPGGSFIGSSNSPQLIITYVP